MLWLSYAQEFQALFLSLKHCARIGRNHRLQNKGLGKQRNNHQAAPVAFATGGRGCAYSCADSTNLNAAGGHADTQGRECENAAAPDKAPGGAGLLPCHPSGKHSPVPASPSAPGPSPCFGEGTSCPAAVVVQGVPVLEAVVLVALVTDHLHHLLLLAARLHALVGEDLKDNVEVVKRNTPCPFPLCQALGPDQLSLPVPLLWGSGVCPQILVFCR